MYKKILYCVHFLYYTYEYDTIDDAVGFIKYCRLGCKDYKDLQDITLTIRVEERGNNDTKTD